jgi:MFS family permease
MAESAAVLSGDAVTPSEHERTYRRNFVYMLLDFILFGVGMGLLSPTTVIPDFVRRLTDYEVLIALSSQLFEAAWLLPQLLVARRLVRVANKKWWFVGPNIAVRPLLFILAGVIVLAGPDRPGLILALFLALYTLAGLGDGLVGVPWLDLLGSSLSSGWRARLMGLGTAINGVAILALAPVVGIILGDSGPGFPNNYALLFATTGVLFILTIPPTLFIRELPGGQPQEVSPPLREYLPSLWRILRDDTAFRVLVIMRVLGSLFALALPFYIGFATERLGMPNDIAVSRLLLMQTLGSVAGSVLFSWMGNRRTLEYIRLMLAVGVMVPSLALLAGAVGTAPLYLTFLASGFSLSSLGFGFMNWVIIYATPDDRPVYTGLFNSVSAVSVLTVPLLGGTIVEILGYEAAFVVSLAAVVAELYVALRYLQAPERGRARAAESPA